MTLSKQVHLFAAQISVHIGRGILVQSEAEADQAYTAYDRAAERGVVWNDTALALPWPVAAGEAVLSDKDAALPPLGAQAWFES